MGAASSFHHDRPTIKVTPASLSCCVANLSDPPCQSHQEGCISLEASSSMYWINYRRLGLHLLLQIWHGLGSERPPILQEVEKLLWNVLLDITLARTNTKTAIERLCREISDVHLLGVLESQKSWLITGMWRRFKLSITSDYYLRNELSFSSNTDFCGN